MQLFTIGQDGQVELDKLWLKTNPVLWNLYERDNVRKVGDTQARKRDKAMREYLFLYKMFNPVESEFTDFSLVERYKVLAKLYKIPIEIKAIALPKATGKDEQRFEDKVFIKNDPELQEAVDLYQQIVGSLVSVRLYNAAKFSLDRKIDYLTSFDPSAVDKQGKLLVTSRQHSDAIEALDKDMANLQKYTTKMRDEIGEKTKTKSTLELGLMENMRRTEFRETNPFHLPANSSEKESASISIDEI